MKTSSRVLIDAIFIMNKTKVIKESDEEHGKQEPLIAIADPAVTMTTSVNSISISEDDSPA